MRQEVPGGGLLILAAAAKREIPDVQPQHSCPHSWMLPMHKAHSKLLLSTEAVLWAGHALCKFCVRCTVNLGKDKGSSFSGFTDLQHSRVTRLIKPLLLRE